MLLFKSISAIVVVGLVVAVSGCGFSPLYGKRQVGHDAAEVQMAQIKIEQIKDRVGQQLRNGLLDRLTPKGAPGNPAYVLTVTVSETISSLGIKKSAIATRANLRLSAAYTLHAIGGKETNTLTSGSVAAISGYDISNSDYTTLVASQNARKSAVREVADDLRTRLAVYFRRQDPAVN